MRNILILLLFIERNHLHVYKRGQRRCLIMIQCGFIERKKIYITRAKKAFGFEINLRDAEKIELLPICDSMAVHYKGVLRDFMHHV